MRKIILALFVIIIGLSGYFAQPKLKEFAGIKEAEKPKPFVPPSSRILKSSRPPVKSVPDDETPPCSALRSDLDRMDFNQDPDDWLSLTSLETFQGCEDETYAERIQNVLKSCGHENLMVNECQVAILALRAQMRMREMEEPGNREEFMDFIFDEFSKTEPNFKKVKEVSRRFLDEAPDDLAMQKVWATSAVISEGDPRQVPAAIQEEIYAVVGENMQSDPDLRNLDVLLKTGLDPMAVESMTRELAEKFPEDKNNIEMHAWALWQQGRREESLRYLDRLPAEDPRISELKKKLQGKDAKKEDFPGRLNIGFSTDDLTR